MIYDLIGLFPAACPMGFLFPIIEFNKSVQIPCETFHRNFSRFKEVTRYCGEEIYDDFSQCTLKPNSNNYIIFVQFQALFRPSARLPGQPINETGLDLAEASSGRLRSNVSVTITAGYHQPHTIKSASPSTLHQLACHQIAIISL